QTPSSSARRSSGWCDSRTRSLRWWSNVGYRKKRSCSSRKCLLVSRMPPLRRVSSCSPSASARTVTAHSLKAIGISKETSTPRTGLPRREGPRGGADSYLITTLFSRAESARRTDWGFRRRLRGRRWLVDGLDYGREVAASEASCVGSSVHRRGALGDGRADAERPRLLQEVAHVLEHVLELEERVEIPLQHRLGLEVEHRRGTRAGGDHRQQGVQVELRPLRHHEGLGQHLRVDRRQGVVDQLD